MGKKTLICFDELDLLRINSIIELHNLLNKDYPAIHIKTKSEAIRKSIKEYFERLKDKVRYAQEGQKTASE